MSRSPTGTTKTKRQETTGSIKTPELDKILSVKDDSHLISEFVDFLKERGYEMGFDVNEELARFFGIDRVKAELERGRLWAAIKSQRN